MSVSPWESSRCTRSFDPPSPPRSPSSSAVSAAHAAPVLKVSQVRGTTATLTLDGVDNFTTWYYYRTQPAGVWCESAWFTSWTLSGLTPGVAYTYTAYPDSSCSGTSYGSVSFTIAKGSVSEITDTTARLSLVGFDDPWYYDSNAPEHRDWACQGPVQPGDGSSTSSCA